MDSDYLYDFYWIIEDLGEAYRVYWGIKTNKRITSDKIADVPSYSDALQLIKNFKHAQVLNSSSLVKLGEFLA